MYDFLYYCYYCLVLKGKKYGTGEERASFMLAVATSLYIISLYFFLTLHLRLIIVNPMVVAVAIGLMLIGMMHIHKVYFVNTGRYRMIRKYYQNTAKRSRFLYGLFALIMFLFAPVAFLLSGILLGQYANPH